MGVVYLFYHALRVNLSRFRFLACLAQAEVEEGLVNKSSSQLAVKFS
jgi:hypothetical protein